MVTKTRKKVAPKDPIYAACGRFYLDADEGVQTYGDWEAVVRKARYYKATIHFTECAPSGDMVKHTVTVRSLYRTRPEDMAEDVNEALADAIKDRVISKEHRSWVVYRVDPDRL